MSKEKSKNPTSSFFERYEGWKMGYVEGINMCGSFLRIFKSIPDNELRKFIEILQEEWMNYGKENQQEKSK